MLETDDMDFEDEFEDPEQEPADVQKQDFMLGSEITIEGVPYFVKPYKKNDGQYFYEVTDTTTHRPATKAIADDAARIYQHQME